MIRHKIEQLIKTFIFGGLCLIKFLWISSWHDRNTIIKLQVDVIYLYNVDCVGLSGEVLYPPAKKGKTFGWHFNN